MKEDPVLAQATRIRSLPEPVGELESLYNSHYSRVLRTAYRVTGNPVDAEDVLQNVFLRLVKGGGSHDMTENPAAYLHRSAVNASLDLLRGRARSRTVALDDTDTEMVVSLAQTPESEHEDRELRTLLRAAVARLSPKTAEMFVLRYFEGFDNKEIAERVGTSQMVVGVMLHRARVRLRKDIGNYLEKHHEA